MEEITDGKRVVAAVMAAAEVEITTMTAEVEEGFKEEEEEEINLLATEEVVAATMIVEVEDMVLREIPRASSAMRTPTPA